VTGEPTGAALGTEEPPLIPTSMEEAVGYGSIDSRSEPLAEDLMVLKHDRLFLLLDGHGEAHAPGALGLFFDDTRILSHYVLRFAGGPASVLSAQVPWMYSADVDLAITDEEFGGDSWDPKHAVHIRREIVLEDELVERLTFTSYLRDPLEFPVRLELASDFADIFEVRGWRRKWRGQFFEPVIGDRSLVLPYRGQDGVLVEVVVRFDEAPDELHRRGASWTLQLDPGVKRVIEWHVAPREVPGSSADARTGSMVERRGRMAEVYRSWRAECARWTTDVAEFNASLRGAVDDLRALEIEAEGTPLLAAGIPWYATIFGRDSIIASLQTLPLNPDLALSTLRYLAARQGRKRDPFTEEEPGKILHELRRGELARAGEIPHVPYYGTVDATPLWIVLLHETWRWTGDDGLVRDLLPALDRALRWIDQFGDADGDGFVEYDTTAGKGLRNKGWKDSGDGVPFPDGTLPEGPIALVEVQGYVYDAKRRAAELFDAFDQSGRARKLRKEAEELRTRILQRYWMEGPGTFALALDGDKRPVPTATSNAGHLLWSGVPDPEQAERLARHLLDPEMFSGWGIRTLAASQEVYNPMSYHNGSVWPHDNAIIVQGLCRYGFDEQALEVLGAMHDVAADMKLHRLPELFCGMRRAGGMRPVHYPVSCSPQAWASGAFFMMLQGVLGLVPEAPIGSVHLIRPRLPRFLRSLTVSGLRIGSSRATLRFRRRGDTTQVGVLKVQGPPLQVRIVHS
jgi:glycogen debranching enzyme